MMCYTPIEQYKHYQKWLYTALVVYCLRQDVEYSSNNFFQVLEFI